MEKEQDIDELSLEVWKVIRPYITRMIDCALTLASNKDELPFPAYWKNRDYIHGDVDKDMAENINFIRKVCGLPEYDVQSSCATLLPSPWPDRKRK